MDIEAIILPLQNDGATIEAFSILQNASALQPPQYPNQIFLSLDSSIGTCDGFIANRLACTKYVYAAFYAVFQAYTGQPPTVWDMLSTVYYGEFGVFRSKRLDPDKITLEALARNFFDSQSGGCRHNAATNSFDCSYENLILWLSTMQSWYKNAVNDNGQIKVDLFTLLGNTTKDFPTFFSRRDLETTKTGIFGWDGEIRIAFEPSNLLASNWHTGQGGGVPSTWGNLPASAGATSIPPSEEIFITFFQHRFTVLIGDETEDIYLYDGDNSLDGNPPNCTLVFVIETTENISGEPEVCP